MRPQKSASAISQNPKLVPDMISRSLTVRRLWLGLGARWLRMNVNNLFYARVVEADDLAAVWRLMPFVDNTGELHHHLPLALRELSDLAATGRHLGEGTGKW